jgi:hypothetical protein
MYSTGDLSRLTGVPISTVKKYVAEGRITRAIRGVGRGDNNAYDEIAVAQVRALAAISRAFGNGELGRDVIDAVLPQVNVDVRALTVQIALPI